MPKKFKKSPLKGRHDFHYNISIWSVNPKVNLFLFFLFEPKKANRINDLTPNEQKEAESSELIHRLSTGQDLSTGYPHLIHRRVHRRNGIENDSENGSEPMSLYSISLVTSSEPYSDPSDPSGSYSVEVSDPYSRHSDCIV
jgi:hypothetical protein